MNSLNESFFNDLDIWAFSINAHDCQNFTKSDYVLLFTDKDLKLIIDDALHYIDASIAMHSLWNEFPIGVKLALSFISVCSTYVIALLQFAY